MKSSQTVLTLVLHQNPGHVNNKRQVTDIQHSTRLHHHQNTTSINSEGHIYRQDRRGGEQIGGFGSCPGASGSTFFVGNRPVNVCKKLALSVCEDMRLPQRSMAYGWDEWNGDN